MNATESMLSIRNLSIDYKNGCEWVKAVKGVSMHIAAGEVVGLVGESGSGKSSVAQAILGLMDGKSTVLKGDIRFCGEPVLNYDNNRWCEIRGRKIGMVFQSPMSSFNPASTIGEQMIEAICWHGKFDESAAYQLAVQALQEVGMPRPEEIMRHYAFELSGGMCQRAALALAIVLEPELVVADEPTASLDVVAQAELIKWLKKLQAARGFAMLIISHDFNLISRLTDRTFVMFRGDLVETGETKNLLSNPQYEYTARLIDAVPKLSAVIGKKCLAQSEGERSETNAKFLKIDEVSRCYRNLGKLWGGQRYSIPAVQKVSLEVVQGETLGLVGESGSGKSTLARMIAGLEKPDQGNVFLNGVEISGKRTLAKHWRRKVQMVFQNPYDALDPMQRIGRAIIEPLDNFEPLERSVERDRVSEVLQEVGLPSRVMDAYPHQLSGGERQRVCIARSLIVKPELLICDEAVSALDKSIQSQVLSLLKRLKERHGLSMLFISHDLAAVNGICDRIAVMKNGEVVEVGDREQMLGNPQHPYTRTLIAANRCLEGVC
ncbi:ABC transporter ATP-binding protein [Thiomicrorhabdus sp.]|uniref:ABC transporter ATP-binding protein n=1 Tax=Thiomicrorhabdus sp. TaxID=2039724 RepID=UPI0029C8937B|nr:ABC transporter ATP-binding protein [Thiomicrorhabdus sp.]